MQNTEPVSRATVEQAQAVLAEWADMYTRRAPWAHAGTFRFWTGAHLPRNRTRGEWKACFQNSWNVASRSTTLAYCEGWAVSGTLELGPLPIEHAWLVDTTTGEVVERTWDIDPARPNVYYGIAIPVDVAREALKRSRGMSIQILFGDWARRGWFAQYGLPAAAEFTAALPNPTDPS